MQPFIKTWMFCFTMWFRQNDRNGRNNIFKPLIISMKVGYSSPIKSNFWFKSIRHWKWKRQPIWEWSLFASVGYKPSKMEVSKKSRRMRYDDWKLCRKWYWVSLYERVYQGYLSLQIHNWRIWNGRLEKRKSRFLNNSRNLILDTFGWEQLLKLNLKKFLSTKIPQQSNCRLGRKS